MLTRPRILLSRRWPAAVEARFAERFDVVVNESDDPIAAEALVRAMSDYDVLCPTVSDHIDASILLAVPRRVGMIGNYGAGFNHIDLDAARRAGVIVTNTPDVLTESTAEIAIMLMLMAARRAGEGEREVRMGIWTGWRPTHMLGTGLTGKTLGLVGYGRIGQAVARIAQRGFGMKLAYYARQRATTPAQSSLDATFYTDLDAMLPICDFVSLHVPSSSENRYLINAARLAAMRPGAILINTARGDIVDEAALASALARRQIAAAGLDVYASEPAVGAALLALENVVLLPHLGSATRQTREAMGMRVLENVTAFCKGLPPPDRVA